MSQFTRRMAGAFFALAWVLFVANQIIDAQGISGTIVGTVRDTSGAVVVDALVTATNIDTGISQSTKAGTEGVYTIPNLVPGTYKVRTQFKGFATAVASNIAVRLEQTSRIDFSLSPGAITSQVEVKAEAPLVQSTTSDLGHVVESNQIEQLPLNGRLFEQLVTIVPGAERAGAISRRTLRPPARKLPHRQL